MITLAQLFRPADFVRKEVRMNRLLSSLVSFSLITMAALLFCCDVSGQAAPAVQTVVPCPQDSGSGRPTLRRRQPTPDNSTPPEVVQTQVTAESVDSGPTAAGSSSGNASVAVTVNFEGLHAFAESDVLKTFRERRVQFSADGASDHDVVEKAVAVLKDLYQSRGYEQVMIDTRRNEVSPTITFLIHEGPRFQVAEIAFEGNRIFSSQELATRMREYLERYESSRSGYDAELFDYCRHKLTNLVRSRGYLQAKFGEPKKEVRGQALVVTMLVDEGKLYRMGEMSVGGASAVSSQQVRAMIDLQSGQIANGELLSKNVYEDLKKVYGELGYIQYTAEITPEFEPISPGEGVVNFKIEIDEGPRFWVRAVKFVGDDLPRPELKSLLLIREGAVFNQRLFEDSVKSLNATGLFEFVDKDKDVDFRSNEEEGSLDLMIKLKRKGS
jgi:outer membrane protein insertion porin family